MKHTECEKPMGYLSPDEILDARIEKIQKSRAINLFRLELFAFIVSVVVLFSVVLGISWSQTGLETENVKGKQICIYYRLESSYQPGDLVIVETQQGWNTWYGEIQEIGNGFALFEDDAQAKIEEIKGRVLWNVEWGL